MKLNDKLYIKKVIIAPVYKLNSKNGYIDINNPYVHDNRWIAIYPVPRTDNKFFYNLHNNFEIINSKSNSFTDEYVVDIDDSKLLIDYLDRFDKYHISYKKLLYITIPITKYEKYKNYDMKRKLYMKFGKKYIVDDIHYKDYTEYNSIMEKKNHFAIDIENNEPVSYGYINDEIPYVLRKRR